MNNGNIRQKAVISGKLMILGEHAVVYGNHCLVSSVNKYLEVNAEISGDKKDVLITPDVKNADFVKKALLEFRKKFKVEEKVKITTKSSLGSYGLGSSSAVTVGTIKVMLMLFAIKISDRELFNLCYGIVLGVQKKASGFDVASCIYGDTVFFDGETKKAELISDEILPIIVGYSGKKAKTTVLVNMVSIFQKKEQKQIKKIFGEIEKIVLEGKDAIIKRDWKSLGKLMNNNHLLLQSLGVSTDKLDRMVFAACESGAYGAKLSGAGGGDCMIACVPESRRNEVRQAIERVGGEVLDINVGKNYL